MIQQVNKAEKGFLDTNKCQKNSSGANGNCSIFHSDAWSSKAQSLKITIKTFSHIS